MKVEMQEHERKRQAKAAPMVPPKGMAAKMLAEKRHRPTGTAKPVDMAAMMRARHGA